MMLVEVTPPEALPISAADARSRLGLGAGVSEDLLEALIGAVTGKVDGPDGVLGRALVTQVWNLVLPSWPEGDVIIPMLPLQAIEAVTYRDPDGVTQTMPVGDYQVVLGSRGSPGRVARGYGRSWPSIRPCRDAVTVRFRAGYGEPEDVPEAIRTAIVLQVSHLQSMSSPDGFVIRERVDGVGQTDFADKGVSGQALCGAAEAMLAPFKVYL
ncbi:phage conserved hypothetical protein, phiE125 gp8 family [Kaistia soli DSM 19436]|uniref:Phage gp6-like head-tail connector protein n=1 Tax=Kaistia soli DSM 19436 TaxID=1122133 RepID=A0A1M4Y9T5_9HYPH|nr:hypothetical protein [Kaistia soli]SHF02398.1 phage conserved hypothetical protein, phiE125 gp8 family [Kaistia soli DSM 19436]